MTDLEQILLLWRELETAGTDYVLALVIAIEGPSYRKPGACMLLAKDGRRAGTISGGCLENEVVRRAFWLTMNSPSVQRYSTAGDDGDRPYGSGCGGHVWVLFERRLTARCLLNVLALSFYLRDPLAVVTILEGEYLGRRAFAGLDQALLTESHPELNLDQGNTLRDMREQLQNLAELALERERSMEGEISVRGSKLRVWINFRPARPGLWIFGAGDDALPLVRLAKTVGWFVTVVDGRSQLVTRERIPLAGELRVLPVKEMPAKRSSRTLSALANLRPQDAAVLMSHSFEQDARILASLLSLESPLAYIGVLGPQRRTRELLIECARLLNVSSAQSFSNSTMIESWLGALHAPTGLDMGAEAPETVALSIVAEIQKSFAGTTALPLSEIRCEAKVICR